MESPSLLWRALVANIALADENLASFHVAGFIRVSSGGQRYFHSICTAPFVAHHIPNRPNVEGVSGHPQRSFISPGPSNWRSLELFVEHARPHCNSALIFSTVILDDNRGDVFHGGEFMSTGSTKNGRQETNHICCFSDGGDREHKAASSKSNADDVKCTIGATVGQLNDDAIFYLSGARVIGWTRPGGC